MARRRGYHDQSRRRHCMHRHHIRMPDVQSLRRLADVATEYLTTRFSSINFNYMAIITIIVIVLLSYILPDISQKLQVTSEVNAMKKVLNIMTKEVKRAEVECLTVANEICCLQCSVRDGATQPFITHSGVNKQLEDLSFCTSCYLPETRSEPLRIENKGLLRRIFFPRNNASHKEITIMSYLYTDSFDDKEQNKIDHQLKTYDQ